ncbi:MAG: hypothetical protein STSR0008_13650 [Ignavibacterium sp.]
MKFKLKFVIPTLLIMIAAILLIFFSLNKNTIIPEDKFVSIYCELLIAKDTIRDNSYKIENYKKELLRKYSISEKDYNSTLNYYSESSKNWESFFDKVIKRLEEKKKE